LGQVVDFGAGVSILGLLFQTAFARPMSWNEITETYMAPGQEDILEAYPYPTPCDGILSNLDTDQYIPRMIAADGIEMHAFRRPCQRHNPLFLPDKDVLVQRVVVAPCSPRSLRKSAGLWHVAPS
jgi:hypothetical protein